MKITKTLLKQIILEQNHHFFGPSAADEKETGLANLRIKNPFIYRGRFKNGDAFKKYIKKYYLKNDYKRLSSTPVKIIPGNRNLLTFYSKDGFDRKNVENIFKPIIIKFNTVESLQLKLIDFKQNQFTLIIE